MEILSFSITREDQDWVSQFCHKETLDVTFAESDGLAGSSEWLEVAVPLSAAAIPFITKIIIKLIEKHGSTKITCGDMTVENISPKDVTKVLNKMCATRQKLQCQKSDEQ